MRDSLISATHTAHIYKKNLRKNIHLTGSSRAVTVWAGVYLQKHGSYPVGAGGHQT